MSTISTIIIRRGPAGPAGAAGADGATGATGVSDSAYNPAWNGVIDIAPSKNAIFDKIESLDSAKQPLDADLTAYANALDAAARRALIGAVGTATELTPVLAAMTEGQIATAFGEKVLEFGGVVFPTGTTAEIDAVINATVNQVMLDTDRKALVRFTAADTYETIISGPVTLKTAYVDHTYGNNATAQLGNERLPYATINAALVAAGTLATIYVRGGAISEDACLTGITEGGFTIVFTGATSFTSANPIFNTAGATTGLDLTILGDYITCNSGKFLTVTDSQTTYVRISLKTLFSGQIECSNANASVSLSTDLWLLNGASSTPTISAGNVSLLATRFNGQTKTITQSGGKVLLAGSVWIGGTTAADTGFFIKSGTSTTFVDIRFAQKTKSFGGLDGKPFNASTAQTIILLGPLAIPVTNANITFVEVGGALRTTATLGFDIGTATYSPLTLMTA